MGEPDLVGPERLERELEPAGPAERFEPAGPVDHAEPAIPAGARRIRVARPPGAGDGPPRLVVPPVAGTDADHWTVDGSPVRATLERRGQNHAVLHTSSGAVRVRFDPPDPAPASGAGASGSRDHAPIEVNVNGWRLLVHVEPARRAMLRERATRAASGAAAVAPVEVRAIIPGRVASIAVSPGETVETGHALLVVEAMKMQNELRAPRAGTVRAVAVAAGQTVEAGALLLVIE